MEPTPARWRLDIHDLGGSLPYPQRNQQIFNESRVRDIFTGVAQDGTAAGLTSIGVGNGHIE